MSVRKIIRGNGVLEKKKSPARPEYTTPFSYGTVPLSSPPPRPNQEAAAGRQDLRQKSEGKVQSDSGALVVVCITSHWRS